MSLQRTIVHYQCLLCLLIANTAMLNFIGVEPLYSIPVTGLSQVNFTDLVLHLIT